MAVFTGCSIEDDYTPPKPKGYFRIDFPEKKYLTYDTACPFTFEYPAYAQIGTDKDPRAERCWINVEFPTYKAKIHLSYKGLDKNIQKYIEDSRNFVMKHVVKASAIDEQLILRDSANVYGLLYDIGGNAASSVQFYLTDSTQHFLRGALYFNTAPNIDSTGIVVDYIKQDIFHMIKTFKWK